jgi:glucokinase
MNTEPFHPPALHAAIVNLVRKAGSLSRVELARQLHVAPSTAGIHADRLVARGFLREERKLRTAAGRRPTLLSLNPASGCFIGVDFDASTLYALSLDFAGRVTRETKRLLPRAGTAAVVLAEIEAAIEGVLPARAGGLLGLGVGVPGLVDVRRGLALDYKYIRGWRDVPLAERLRRRFRAPVYLENNIRSMSLAELWFGQGRTANDFVCLGVRSGIAAGIVIGGRVLHGRNHAAGEVGRWEWPANGGGRRVQVQDVASVRAILERVARQRLIPNLQRGEAPDFEMLEQALASGNQRVARLVRDGARVLGALIVQLVELLNPEKIILASPLTHLKGVLFEEIHREARRELDLPPGFMPEIVASELGEYVGALGAAGLVMQQWRPAA